MKKRPVTQQAYKRAEKLVGEATKEVAAGFEPIDINIMRAINCGWQNYMDKHNA